MIIPFLPVRALERDSLDTGTSATATNDSVDGRNTSRDLEEFVVKADDRSARQHGSAGHLN